MILRMMTYDTNSSNIRHHETTTMNRSANEDKLNEDSMINIAELMFRHVSMIHC